MSNWGLSNVVLCCYLKQPWQGAGRLPWQPTSELLGLHATDGLSLELGTPQFYFWAAGANCNWKKVRYCSTAEGF